MSTNIQMYFSLVALYLFCSQTIITSQMLFLNRTLCYHKYRQKVMYSNLCNKISINSLFSLSINLHLHSLDLNIKLEDTAWEGRWKNPLTSKSGDVNPQNKHILSEEQVVFIDHSEDPVVLKAALLAEFSQYHSNTLGLNPLLHGPLTSFYTKRRRYEVRWSFVM